MALYTIVLVIVCYIKSVYICDRLHKGHDMLCFETKIVVSEDIKTETVSTSETKQKMV